MNQQRKEEALKVGLELKLISQKSASNDEDREWIAAGQDWIKAMVEEVEDRDRYLARIELFLFIFLVIVGAAIIVAVLP